MINKQLFDKENIYLFEPYDGVEFIYSVLQNLNITNFKTNDAREKGLETIEKLLDLELIEIFHWGDNHKQFADEIFSNAEIMMHIKTVWFVGADFSDFNSMPMFKFKDWYIKSLENAGMTHTTDWSGFVENKIGDLERWIEKHRPSKT